MNLFSLEYIVQITDSTGYGERITMGLSTMIFGMLVVFSVLILLWGILELFHFAFAKATSKKPNANATKKEIVPPAPIPQVAPVVPTPATDDGAMIAAITAAIALTLQKPTTSFRVVSFQRTTKNTPWNQKKN